VPDKHFKEVKDERKVVELAIYAGYLTGFHRYYHVGSKYGQRLKESGHPFLEMYRLMIKEFKKPFGDCQVGRISCTGVKFEDVFLDEDGEMTNGAMDAMVDCVMEVLDWINKTVASDDEFTHVNIEKKFQECLGQMRERVNGNPDFAEFRLMVAVQICCLAKVVVKGHKNLHNLVYPVAGLGAAEQLKHVDATERPTVLKLIHKESGMEAYGYNACEGHLCETAEHRVGKMFDFVFIGQSLFCHGLEFGENFVKEYLSDTWQEF